MAKKAKKLRKRVSPEKTEATTALLMRAATKLFAEKGYDGTTVKEIASLAGVNISLVSYHFHGKEGLFHRCLEDFGKSRLLEAEQILTRAESIADFKAKIKLWSQQFLLCHTEDDNVCDILHRENLMKREFTRKIFENTFLKAFDAMVAFIQMAKKDGILKASIDPLLASAMIYGAFIHLGQTQDVQMARLGISIKDEKFRKMIVDQYIAVLLNGIS